MRKVQLEELVALLTRILIAHGAEPSVAGILAQTCANCERDGSSSHGLFRIPGIARILAEGEVHGRLDYKVEDAATGVLRADAGGGFAQPVLDALRSQFVNKVRQNGIAMLAIRNAHHMSALWPDIEPFAEDGMVALTMVNCFAVSAPFGANAPVFGTNPFGLAAPRAGGHPIVFDMATSAMSHGDIQLAANSGREVPEETGRDAGGRPTTDPTRILDGGTLLPFGGYKGACISMMVELLCAALGGGALSRETGSQSHHGVFPSITGQTIIAIDERQAEGGGFADRARRLVGFLEEAGVTRLPGSRRHATRARALREGIPVSNDTWSTLLALAEGPDGAPAG